MEVSTMFDSFAKISNIIDTSIFQISKQGTSGIKHSIDFILSPDQQCSVGYGQ